MRRLVDATAGTPKSGKQPRRAIARAQHVIVVSIISALPTLRRTNYTARPINAHAPLRKHPLRLPVIVT
jgi:hypothetical protein